MESAEQHLGRTSTPDPSWELVAPRDLPLPNEFRATPPESALPVRRAPGDVDLELGSASGTHGSRALGYGHVITMEDSELRVKDRAGNVISRLSPEAFWSGLGASSVSAPQVHWDASEERWVACAIAEPLRPTSAILLGVSSTADPTGTWYLYRIDPDPIGETGAVRASIGFNRNWITVQASLFSSYGLFENSSIFVFGKSDVYGGGAGNYTRFTLSGVGTTQVPALTYDDTQSSEYLVGTWNESCGAARLYCLSGSIGCEQLSYGDFILGPEGWCSKPMPGTAAGRLAAGDAEGIQCVVYRDGRLWIATKAGASEDASMEWWSCRLGTGVTHRD
jgi:hypothetical protein